MVKLQQNHSQNGAKINMYENAISFTNM